MITEHNDKKRCTDEGCPTMITVFTSKSCKPCHKLVPSIVEQGDKAGFIVEVIDVYSEKLEDRVRSSHVRWVPHIEYLGREITVLEFETLIGRRVTGGG